MTPNCAYRVFAFVLVTLQLFALQLHFGCSSLCILHACRRGSFYSSNSATVVNRSSAIKKSALAWKRRGRRKGGLAVALQIGGGGRGGGPDVAVRWFDHSTTVCSAVAGIVNRQRSI